MNSGSIPADGAPARLYALVLSTGGVHRIDTADGTVTDIAVGLSEAPDGIVADEREGYAYFTLMGAPDEPLRPGVEPPFEARNGSVQRVALAGGEPEVVVPRGAFTTGKQLATDPASGRLYWCDREGRGVYCAERDGSSLTQLVSTVGRGPSAVEEQCVGVAVDAAGGWLYWSQKGPSDGGRGRIFRAPLTMAPGATAETRDDVETLWQDLPEPIDLELSPDGRTLYWTDRGAAPLGNTLNTAPVPEPGAPGAAPTVVAGDFHEAIGLAVDHPRALAYVSDLSGTIRRIALDGSDDRILAKLPGMATGLALQA